MAAPRTVQRRAQSADETGTSEVRAVLDAIRRIVQALRVGASDGERRAGVSSAQLFALQRIAEHPGASINDVARLTFTHQSSVSVVIQRLVAQRLVVKVAAENDRRRQHLALTMAGRRMLRNAPVAVQEPLIAAIAALRTAERRALARTLSEVAGRVTPKGASPHPPMLFEDGTGGDGSGRSGSRRRRRPAAKRSSSARPAD